MIERGRILIADDEETFLHATADLLRQAGFDCETALDGHTAAHKLATGEFDLLIADIKMPGNMELDLVKNLPPRAEGMPVILATGYPSMATAIQAIALPVAAYVLKPCDFDDLLAKVRSCLDQAQTLHAVRSTHERLSEWQRELERVDLLVQEGGLPSGKLSTSTYLALTVENVIGSLLDIKHLLEAIAERRGHSDASALLVQSNDGRLQRTLEDAIALLRRKESFASDPDLRELRGRLENALPRFHC